MAYFNPQPYSAAMPDLLSKYLEGQQMGQEAQTMRSSHEMQRAQQALKTQAYNRLFQNQQQQYQMPMQMDGGMPMQYQQMPMQMGDNMPMQQQQMPMQMNGGMPMQRGSNLNMQDMILQNELLGLPKGKIENIDGQNYYIMPTGEYYPVGPAAPTEREKLFTKSDVDKYNDVQNEYNELVDLDDVIEGLADIKKYPFLKDYLSNLSNDYFRNIANKGLAALGGDDRARFVAELEGYANRLVVESSGKFKGAFTNQELSLLKQSKPSARDRPEVLIQKISDLKKLHDLAKKRLELTGNLMRYGGLDYISSSKIAKESIKSDLNSKKENKEDENKEERKIALPDLQSPDEEMPEQVMPIREQVEEAPGFIREQVEEAPGFIREQVEMPGAYYDLEQDSFDTPDLGLIRGLRKFGANKQTGFDKFAEPLTRGSAQGLYDFAKSPVNWIPDIVEHVTGYNAPRVPNINIQNPDAVGSEAILQNLGNIGSRIAASIYMNNALGTASNVSSFVQSLGLSPKAEFIANMLAHGAAGGLEGAAFGEGDRSLSALAGTLFGSLYGTAKGGHEYYKGIQHEKIGKDIAKNIPAAERAVGEKISQSLANAEKAGASIKVDPEIQKIVDLEKKLLEANKKSKRLLKKEATTVAENAKEATTVAENAKEATTVAEKAKEAATAAEKAKEAATAAEKAKEAATAAEKAKEAATAAENAKEATEFVEKIDPKAEIIKSLRSKYKNDWHAVSEFAKNPTLENAHWAQSALGKIESNLSAPAKNSYGNKFNHHTKEYVKELSNKIRASMSQAFQDAKLDPKEYTGALSEYADLARISKSKPLKQIRSLGLNARNSDYEKLAKAIASDASLSGLASPYSKGLPERNQLDKLYDSLYKIGLITTPPLAGTMAYDYLSNALSREQ